MITREEKLKLVEKLPQQLQDFLYSEDLGAFLFHLGYKYNLTEDKVSALARAIADIVLGIAPMTGLVREIIDKKIVADAQTAANIAQEVNTELLAPIMAAPATPLAPSVPSADHYREPIAEAPQIVDLRKTPPPPMSAPVAAAPIPPPAFQPKAGPPLTFTKPIEPIPLIEAEPHKIEESPLPPKIITPPTVEQETRPQFIMRPPGFPPTDLSDDILDLRKDKGEF
jgi:hypothetical protein